MAEVVRLSHARPVTLPLANGATVRLTLLRGSDRVAVELVGPRGGYLGGLILGSERARLLAAALEHAAAECEGQGAGAPAPGEGAPWLDDESLAAFARSAVPVFADWCATDVVNPDGSIRRLPLAHADPLKARLAEKLREYPPDPRAPHPRSEVLRVGRPYVQREVPETSMVAAARDRVHLEIMRGLGCRSSMGVPLVAGGRVLGVMTFVWAESAHRYDEADLGWAQALARSAALAVENARLHRESQAVLRTERRKAIERRWRPPFCIPRG
jgi:GAF domain-containing protein